MSLRKMIPPLLVALACVAVGVGAGGSAVAAPKPSKQGQGKAKPLRIAAIDVGTAAGPLTLRVRADVKTQLELKVNGKRVRHSFQMAAPRVQTIELRATDNLRAGRNVLKIRGMRAGVRSAASRTVTVPGWALRADAGADRDAIVRRHAQVGTAPPLGAAGGSVRYRWRVVERPRGAPRPRIVGAGRAQPTLKAKKPGTYVLQLTADPSGDGEPNSSDQVVVTVTPADPPIGVPINTIDQSNGISIGGQSYGGGSSVDAIAYVVLSRTSREVVKSGRVDRDAKGIAELSGLADSYGGGGNYMRYSMILSGNRGVPEANLDDFASVMKKIGVALPSDENFQALRIGLPFSVIGVPGAPGGAATIRIPGGYNDPVSGAITGYLQKNQAVDAEGAPLYEYAAPQLPFDTKAPGSADKVNKMTIGDMSFTGTLPANASAGLHVVVIESLSLRPLSSQVLVTNGGSDGPEQADAATRLANAINRPGGPLVLVQTIGKPKAAGPEWEGIVQTLGRLGANPQLVNALNGSNEYALVTRFGAKAPPAESSTAADAGPYPPPNYPPARLLGTIARSRTSNYVPNVFSTPTDKAPEGGVNLELMRIAYQAAQNWPPLAPASVPDAEVSAAQKYICEELGFCKPANSCPTLRDCYWQNYGADWSLKYTMIGNVGFADGKGFNEAAFKAVKAQLLKEVGMVANVKSYLKALQEPYDRSATRSYVDLQGIGKNIWDSVQRGEPDNTTSWVLGLIGKIASIGTVSDAIRGPAAGLAAVFGLASYLSDKQGQPILGSEIKARSDALGNEMLDRIDLARRTMNGVGMLLVSDYGKLSTVSNNLDTDPWKVGADPELVQSNIRTATRRWFYEALIPTAYPYLIRANNNNARNLDCNLGDTRGWPNQPDTYQMNATVGYDTNGNPINGIFFFSRGWGGGMSPPGSLGDEMFRPLNKDGLAMEKLLFFTPRVFGGRIYHAIDHTPWCSVGFLPRGT